MSKVLIDRAVLEATLKHAEFVSGAACEADDAIRAVLVAPSGTPELPVKAYYHEAPNEYGGLNKSVGLEVRKTFADEPLVLESDALAQIACLEGEIAKRDETIARLEPQLNRAIQANYDLREELAACRVAVENCEVFRARIAELEDDLKCAHSMLAEVSKAGMALRAELAAIKAQEPVAYISGCYRDVIGGKSDRTPLGAELAFVNMGWIGQIPLYAAPVSEAKAQGVVMLPSVTEVMNIVFDYQHNKNKNVTGTTNWAANIGMAVIDEIARLNATPVQQVSVPEGWMLVPVNATEAILDVLYSNGMDESYSLLQDIWSAMLAAVQAAPAADAGYVFYGMDGDHP